MARKVTEVAQSTLEMVTCAVDYPLGGNDVIFWVQNISFTLPLKAQLHEYLDFFTLGRSYFALSLKYDSTSTYSKFWQSTIKRQISILVMLTKQV